jgi:hypothetical protein
MSIHNVAYDGGITDSAVSDSVAGNSAGFSGRADSCGGSAGEATGLEASLPNPISVLN